MSTKRVLWIVGGVVGGVVLVFGGGIALLLYWVFTATGEAALAADRLLIQVREGKIAEAYDSTATDLRAQQNLDAFTADVKALGLTRYASSDWSSRSIVNDEATLEGVVRTRDGDRVPLRVTLVKQAGAWRVASLTSSRYPGGSRPTAIPPEDQLRRLARKTLLDFNRGVARGDFTDFHATLSRPFQEQKTPAELKELFRGFLGKQIDLSGIDEVDPVFDAPELDPEGVLKLSGFYPAKPSRVAFQLKYVYERPSWKLLGIHVALGD
jgi:hypothetical protein